MSDNLLQFVNHGSDIIHNKGRVDTRYYVYYDSQFVGIVIGNHEDGFYGYNAAGGLVQNGPYSGKGCRTRAAYLLAYLANVRPGLSGKYRIEENEVNFEVCGPKIKGAVIFVQRDTGHPDVMRYPHRKAPPDRLSWHQNITLTEWCSEQFVFEDADRWARFGSVYCFRDEADAILFMMRWNGQEIEETKS